MANELRVRQDFVAGALTAPLTVGATSMSSAGLQDLMFIDSSNFCSVGLFRTDASGRVIQKEIVWVIDHGAGASTATIVRGRENTTAVAWDAGDRWSHSQTARDITVICTSTTRPTNPHRGLEVYEIDTGAKRVWDGIAWQSASGIPVGTIIFKTKALTPAGFLRTDGSLVDKDVYSALFSEIGFDYSPTPGVDPGSNQFYLPNTQGRTFVDLDIAQTEFDTVGKQAGSKTSTAPHTHDMGNHTHSLSHTHSYAHTHSTDVVSTNHAHNVYTRNMDTGTVSSWHRHAMNHWHTANWANNHWNATQTHGHHDRGSIGSEAPWEGANWAGSVPVNVDGTAQAAPGGANWTGDPNNNHTHNANHDHPSTNYQNEAPWAGNWQHEHTTDSQSTSTSGGASSTTTSVPSSNTSGASSASAASGNLQPYMVLVGYIKF